MADEVQLIGPDVSEFTGLLLENQVYLSQWEADLSGLLTNIYTKCLINGAVKVGIYSHSDEGPSGLLASGDGNVANGIIPISVDPPISITQGDIYWLAVNSNVQTVYRGGSGTGTSLYKSFSFSDPLPNPAGAEYISYSRAIALQGWGTLASGGAGRLIGSGDPSMIHVAHPKMIHVAKPSLIRARGG